MYLEESGVSMIRLGYRLDQTNIKMRRNRLVFKPKLPSEICSKDLNGESVY